MNTIIDKKEYYKVGSRMLNARMNIELPQRRTEEYYRYLTGRLAHCFLEQVENEFSKSFSRKLDSVIENYRVDLGKVSVTIPERAIHDLISVCTVEVRDDNYDKTYEVEPIE